MKNVILGLSVLAISGAIALPVQANAPEANATQVAYLARNGYFREEGIPSFSALENAMRQRTMTVEQIVQAAIKQKRVHEDRANDSNFIKHVSLALYRM